MSTKEVKNSKDSKATKTVQKSKEGKKSSTPNGTVKVAKAKNDTVATTTTTTEQVKMEKEEKQVEVKLKQKKVKPVKEAKEEVKVNLTEQVAEKQSEQADEVQVEQVDEVTNQMKFEQQLTAIREEMKVVRDKLQSLNNNLKSLESAYNHDIKKVQKTTRKRTKGKKTGFAKSKLVPDKLAEFIEVAVGTELTGPEITSKVWDQLKKRKLIAEEDGRVFRTNKEVTEVFGVPKSVNKSVDYKDTANGFNFYNLQRYISNASH